jgi:hypothetical protein
MGIRGLVLTAAGRITQLSGDSTIRKSCTTAELGILGCPNLDGNFIQADTQYIQNALEALAAQSGFPELEHVPFASYGTSVGGILAWEMAYAYPNRFFGIIQDNAVYTKKPAWAPAGANLSSVPLLLSRGYNEPVGDKPWLSRDSVLAQRALGGPANMILQAGIGHFSWTTWEAKYMGKWLEKAAAAIIPSGPYARTGPVALLPVSVETGWLSDTNFTSGTIASGLWVAYPGEKAKAFWHFDEEMATLWMQMHQGQFSRTAQLGDFANNTFSACTNPWQTCTTLNMGDYPNPIQPGALTNASLPVRYGVYNGAFSPGPGNTISLDPTLVDETATGWIVAIQEGNETHQGWEQGTRFTVAKKNSGTDQAISVQAIADQADTASPIPLTATASSGLPVVVRIKSGPAEVVGSQIVLRQFAGDSGAVAQVIVRYGQGGNAVFKTAALRTDTFLVRKTTRLTSLDRTISGQEKGRLFPNPGQERVFWRGEQAPGKFLFFDLQGRLQKVVESKSANEGLDVSDLLPGMYSVQVFQNGKWQWHRFVCLKNIR